MIKDHEKGQIIRVKNEIAAGEYSYIDSFYNQTSWNIFDVADLLSMCLLADVQDLNEFMVRFKHAHKTFFSILNEGIQNGNIKVIYFEEVEDLPSNPKFMPGLSLINYLKRQDWYLNKKHYEHNPNHKILSQHVSKDDVLRYVNNMNLRFPVKGPIAKVKCNQSSRLEAIYTEGDNSVPQEIKEQLIKQSRSDAGKNKGKKWRNFSEAFIKPLVEHELKECLCLHGVMAKRLNEDIANEAKNILGTKEFENIKDGLPDKIEDEVKKLFYAFDKAHNNVRSRVYRGKYYKEYDHVPCSLHSGK